MNLTYPIGVFDSGLGGLNVLRELRRVLPKEDYAYLADNKNSPYGIKSKEEIVALVREAIKFFEKLPVKLIVLACNTSSAYLGILQQETKLPVLGVILPTVRAALKSGKDLAVLATAATIDSGVYQNLLGEKKYLKNRKIAYLKCSEFVSAIESGLMNCRESRRLVREKLGSLTKPDAFVLACTHFDMYQPEILELFPEAKFVSSGKATAKAVQGFLKKNGLLSPKKEPGMVSLYITGEFENFRKHADLLLNRQVYQKTDLSDKSLLL